MTPEGFELDTLLAPIAGDNPVGADLREDFSAQSIYFKLRDGRAEARAAERASDASGAEEQVPPQWRTVRDLAATALQTLTKDLEIASWYTEAMIRSDGLDGLAAGATLIAGLAAAFWDQGLYPIPDEDGIETRVAPITGLNGQGGDGTLVQPLRKLALFRRPTGEPLFYYQYEDAVTVAGIAETARRQSRIKAGSLAFADVEGWAKAAGAAHFAGQRSRVQSAQAAWTAMAAILDEKAGLDSPATGRVRDLLADIGGAIARYAPAQVEAPDAVDAPSDDATAATGAARPAGAANIATREDMLRDLARIADWFRRNEPHSPLAYTLDDAVRRGRMGWPDLLAELVGDAGPRNAILNSLGIRPMTEGGA